MKSDMATALRLVALRDHAASELREAAKAGTDTREHIREAQAALQRALELEEAV